MLGSAEGFGAGTKIQVARDHAQVKPRYWAFAITNSAASHVEMVVGRRLHWLSATLVEIEHFRSEIRTSTTPPLNPATTIVAENAVRSAGIPLAVI
jgi:hypothetical protein